MDQQNEIDSATRMNNLIKEAAEKFARENLHLASGDNQSDVNTLMHIMRVLTYSQGFKDGYEARG